jgi:hypothetical protein
MGPEGKYLGEWRQFGEVLLQKSSLALTNNSEGQQSRAAAAVAFAIARASILCCNVVMDSIMPVLLAKSADTCGSLQASIFKVYVYVYIYVYIYTYIYVHIYIYISQGISVR